MQINLLSEGVETYQNAADNKTKIFEMRTPDALERLVQDRALLVMKLRDSSGEEIAADAKIVFGVKEPIQTFDDKISEKSYQPYRTKSLDAQYNDDENRKMRLDIKSGGVRLEEGDSISIHIKSDTKIDVEKCTIEINDIDEQRM